MTVQELGVAFADVRGDALRWAIGLPPRPALAARSIDGGDGVIVELRILGASHQVLVHDPAGTLLLSETVACDLPGSATMPDKLDLPGYSFSSVIEKLDPVGFGARVEELTDTLSADDSAIVASFPGDLHAVTGIRLRLESTVRCWESWHAYPQTGELVHTHTRITQEMADV
jgi:hypothetical protein